MRHRSAASILVGILVVLAPSLAHAQATLAGVVRDASEAVLPGVTVEASSSALIEKVRTAVTDGSGQYRITELKPGTYTLTFSLTGFSSVKREGINVSGSGVITINGDLKVGTVEETITVSGETPVVDIQSARRQAVLSSDVLNSLPATRSYSAVLAAVPGLQVQNNANLGAAQTPGMSMFTANGGRANEGRMMIDGLNVAAPFNGGGVSTFIYDIANAEEMQVTVSGALGEAENGGPQLNLVPKSGGNTYKGSFFYSGASKWSTGNNLDGGNCAICTTPAGVIKAWDISGAGGGPIKKDRLWFFANMRKWSNVSPAQGVAANLNQGDATKWTWAPDPNVQVRSADARSIQSIRLTSQVTPRNRVGFYDEHQHRCAGSTVTPTGDGCRTRESDWIGVGTATSSPESFPGYHDLPYYVTQATWSSPVSNKLLLEAGYSRFQYLWAGFGQVPPDGLSSIIPVTESALAYNSRANYSYRGLYDPLGFAFADNDANPNNWRFAASYVTGAHSIKAGYQGSYQKSLQARVANTTQLRYVFNSPVVNGQITNPTAVGVGYYIAPRWEQNDRTESQSLFVQDQWTMKRLTLQGAVRYDRAWSWAPADHNGATATSRFDPQPITFPETVSVSGYNDITPRFGAAYDVFGTGKTSIRVNGGRYLQAATNDANYWANNPALRTVTNVANRAWTDGNKNFAVDCDLTNPAAQNNLASGGDSCAALTGNNLNFGLNPSVNTTLTTINPEILKGWGVRPYDWQFGAAVQQELLPRVSVEVSYNRRWFGNFFVTDNQATVASDYDKWTITAPQSAAVPSSGQSLQYYMVNAVAGARPARNYQTFEPARTQYWHGFTTNLVARLRNGVNVQAGTTTGRGVVNVCALYAALPEANVALLSGTQSIGTCDITEPFLTSFRALASYTIPKVDVLVSASLRSVPNADIGMGETSATNGLSRAATWNVPNTFVQQTLGRLPVGAFATGVTNVNLIRQGDLYGPRVNQVDMRFAKVIRFGGRRADIGIDLYNIFNTSNATTLQETFDFTTNGATYMQPTGLVSPRFARFNLTVNF
jgi:hypothetical protein